jgi:hypothetical protein
LSDIDQALAGWLAGRQAGSRQFFDVSLWGVLASAPLLVRTEELNGVTDA